MWWWKCKRKLYLRCSTSRAKASDWSNSEQRACLNWKWWVITLVSSHFLTPLYWALWTHINNLMKANIISFIKGNMQWRYKKKNKRKRKLECNVVHRKEKKRKRLTTAACVVILSDPLLVILELNVDKGLIASELCSHLNRILWYPDNSWVLLKKGWYRIDPQG